MKASLEHKGTIVIARKGIKINVMEYLSKHGPCSSTEIIEGIGVTREQFKGGIKEAKAQGYADAVREGTIVLYRLTKLGQARLTNGASTVNGKTLGENVARDNEKQATRNVDKEISEIHQICMDAGIPPGDVVRRVRLLAEQAASKTGRVMQDFKIQVSVIPA